MNHLGKAYFSLTILAVSAANASAQTSTPDASLGFTVILILAALYFLPTLIAGFRGHANWPGIFLLNLFLGWTLLGWVGALIWSVLAKPLAKG